MSALSDTEELFEQMIVFSNSTLISLLNSFQVLVMDSTIRSKLFNIVNENKGEALLSILLTPYDVITICKNEAVNVVSHDVVLIQNLILSSESLQSTESLVPICLPGISDAGYLQLYCKFIRQNLCLVFVTESQDHSMFIKFTEQAEAISEKTDKEHLFDSISNALSHRNKSINKEEINSEKLFDEFLLKLTNKSDVIPNMFGYSSLNDPFSSVKYLICENKNINQFFTFRFNDFDKITLEENNVIANYCELYDIYKNQNLMIDQSNFFHYVKDENFSHIIQTKENYILFCTFSYFKDFTEINALTSEIIKLIKNKESYFFLNKI
jgi:hypothetical protein